MILSLVLITHINDNINLTEKERNSINSYI